MNSLTMKLFAVGMLILVLLIPAAMIDSTVSERRGRRDAAIEEIHEAWSRDQFLRGPILTVPVRVLRGHDKKGEPIYDEEQARFTPLALSISGTIDTEPRYRGIYKTVVYTAKLTLSGRFGAATAAGAGLPGGQLLWERARVAVGVSDPRGIKETSGGTWNGKELVFEPGTGGISELKSGLDATVARSEEGAEFSIPLTVRGSTGLSFLPAGRVSEVKLASAWPRPSFWGAFLPDARQITAKGFDASWKVLHINRSLPAAWTGSADLEAARFGVSLLAGNDGYASASRSTKYAVLFIFLTFLSFFLLEFFQGGRLHPVQYLMVGSALVLFYLLLLSLSEQMRFGLAYLIAAGATVGVITGYARAVFRRPGAWAAVGSSTGGLYAYLYILLRLEDYALLLGSLGLLFSLSLVMYLTRGIDWYGVESPSARAGA